MPASAPLPRKCGRRALFAWDGQPWSCRRSTGGSVALCEDWRAFSTGSRVASPAALAAIRSLICRRWLFQVVGSARQSEPVRRLAAVPQNAGESLVKAAGFPRFQRLPFREGRHTSQPRDAIRPLPVCRYRRSTLRLIATRDPCGLSPSAQDE